MITERQEIAKFLRTHFLFKQLSGDTIAEIALACGVLSIKPDKNVYICGAPANAFFVLLSGCVSVIESSNHSTILSGDCFGYEALSKKTTNYRHSAIAIEQSIILLFEPAKLMTLLEKDSDLKKMVRLLLRFNKIKESRQMKWLTKEEDVKYVTRRHIYDLYRRLTTPLTVWLISTVAFLLLKSAFLAPQTSVLAWLSPTIILFTLWVIWLILDWHNDYYVITNQRVLLLERTYLFYETRYETPLEAIQTIGIATELLGRLLTYGSVSVKTLTGTIKLLNLEAPALIVDLLDHYISKQKERSTVRSRLDYEKILQERIAHPEKIQPAQSGSVVELLPSASQHTGKRLFALKVISPDSIMYRTHWFILLKKAVIPLSVFCAGTALLILYTLGKLTVFNADWMFAIVLLISLVSFAALVYQFLDWRNDQYIITKDQLIDINRKPLGHEEKRTAPIKNIQTIEYKRKGIFGLLFNFGTVYIHVGDTDLTFDFVHNPSQVQQDLFAQFMLINQMEKNSQLHAESDRMVDWIKAYHQITGGQKNNTTQMKNE